MVEFANIRIADTGAFLSEFMTKYLEGGFGRMNKTDVELLLMYLFVKSGSFSGLSNFDISVLLKIPESKVRRMKYEAELRYGNHEESQEELLNLLINCRAEYSKEYIRFSIEDKFTQALFISELKKTVNSFADFSFNPEIVKVSKDVFAAFLAKKYCVEAEEEFSEEYQQDDFPMNEGESGAHYCLRFLFEKSRPIREILETISSMVQGTAASLSLFGLMNS